MKKNKHKSTKFQETQMESMKFPMESKAETVNAATVHLRDEENVDVAVVTDEGININKVLANNGGIGVKEPQGVPERLQELAKIPAVVKDTETHHEMPAKETTASTEKSRLLICKKKCSPWQAVGESVVGLAHRRGAVPTVCQDAHYLDTSERLIATVCDGAGSSVLSEVGSQQMSQSIVRLMYSLEPVLTSMLDTYDDLKLGNKVAEIIYRYAIRLLQDIARNNKRETRDFRTTLLLIVTGKENTFWYKIGDGEIVIEDKGKLSCVGKSIKGEYSNETVFVDQSLKRDDVQYGLLESAFLSGIALMSDGGAERLISSSDRSKVAPKLSAYFDLLRNSKLPREELYKFLTDYETWRGTTHDDKTLLVAARKEE